jgi:hypothetical protein
MDTGAISVFAVRGMPFVLLFARMTIRNPSERFQTGE